MSADRSELWRAAHEAAYGDPFADPPRPRMCVVSARYGGCYEAGLFVVVPVADVYSDAFGGDGEASNWWYDNRGRTGAGNTPDEALMDWFVKTHVRGMHT